MNDYHSVANTARPSGSFLNWKILPWRFQADWKAGQCGGFDTSSLKHEWRLCKTGSQTGLPNRGWAAQNPVTTGVNTTAGLSGKRRESVGKASGMILDACRDTPSITIAEIAKRIGITERSVQRNIQKLQSLGLLRRIGGRKEGYWQVIE